MVGFDHSSGSVLERDTARIYFETVGHPEGEPLVFLHGGLGSLLDFREIVPLLSDRFRCIGIDLRGHGRSTRGDARMCYATYQEDVEAVLSHLEIASFSLFGFSDGGIIAYRMAAADVDRRIRRLVTLGAQWRLDTNDQVYGLLRSMTAEVWRDVFPEAVRYYGQVNPEPDFNVLMDAVVGVWTDTDRSGYPAENVRKIKTPTLILRGDEDFLLSLDEAVSLRSRLDAAHFMNVPFASHAAHEEALEMCMMAVNQFLSPDAA